MSKAIWDNYFEIAHIYSHKFIVIKMFLECFMKLPDHLLYVNDVIRQWALISSSLNITNYAFTTILVSF